MNWSCTIATWCEGNTSMVFHINALYVSILCMVSCMLVFLRKRWSMMGCNSQFFAAAQLSFGAELFLSICFCRGLLAFASKQKNGWLLWILIALSKQQNWNRRLIFLTVTAWQNIKIGCLLLQYSSFRHSFRSLPERSVLSACNRRKKDSSTSTSFSTYVT